MRSAADEISETLAQTVRSLRAVSDEAAARKPEVSQWSRKEMLGHLVDSATNNHQRFVRASLSPRLEFPPYAQNEWVDLQDYQNEPWAELIDLWESLNRHLVHLLRRIPEDAGTHEISIGGGPAVTLEFLARDYVRHLRHHLEKIAAAD